MKTHRLSVVALVGLTLLAGCKSPFLRSAENESNSSSQIKQASNTAEDSVKAANRKETISADYWGDKTAARRVERAGGAPADRRPLPPQREFDSVSNHLRRGREEAERGNLEPAKLAYRRVLETHPDHADAHHQLAIIADMQQDYRTAERHYQVALQQSPTNSDVLSDLGWSYILQGRYRESEGYLNEALRYNRSHPLALNRLGYLHAQQNDYEQALAMFRLAGTEDEAQAKMKQLFSQGKPAGSLATAPNVPLSNGAFAANNSLPAGSFAGNAPPPAATRVAPNETTRQLQEMMEQERQRGLAARNQPLAPQSTNAPNVFGPHDLNTNWNDDAQSPQAPLPVGATAAQSAAFGAPLPAVQPPREFNALNASPPGQLPLANQLQPQYQTAATPPTGYRPEYQSAPSSYAQMNSVAADDNVQRTPRTLCRWTR
jgi:tetratricopeptide (TPR) repeat protein